MESVAVIQFSTEARYGYEGPMSRAMSALLSNRLSRIGPLNALHVELRELSDDAEGAESPLQMDANKRLLCMERLDDQELLHIASRLQLNAKHWLLGKLEFNEENQEISLGLELVIMENAMKGQLGRSWEKVFSGEMDEVADLLNQATIAIASYLLEAQEFNPSVLSVETRSFEAFQHYCYAMDAEDDSMVRLFLERACHADSRFLDALGSLALDALAGDDNARYDELSGELLHAGHLRPNQFTEQLSKLEYGGFQSQALALAMVAARLSPERLELLRMLAHLALHAERSDAYDALELLVEQKAPHSQDMRLLANLSALYRLCGDEERAEAMATLTVQKQDGYYELGMVSMETGNYDLACLYLEKTLDSNPNHLAVRTDLAGTYIQMARFQDAANLLRGYDGESAVLDSNLALALRHSGELEEAHRIARSAVELDPNHPQAWAVLGELCCSSGDLEEACIAFQTALTLDPENLFWHRELGRVLFHMGFYDQALEFFSVVMERLPDLSRITPEILFVMAQMAEGEQGIEAAKALLYSALELEPDFWQAANNLAVLLMRQDHYEEAERLLLAAIEIVPDNEGVRMNLDRAERGGNDP